MGRMCGQTALASTDKIDIVAFSLKVVPPFSCLLNTDLFRGSLLGFWVNTVITMDAVLIFYCARYLKVNVNGGEYRLNRDEYSLVTI